jgi:CBS domain-containing protein
MNTIEDLMTRKVISVFPDTPLVEAVTTLTKHGFNGLPVVDKQNMLVGLLTEYNMISQGSYVHLKTLINLFNRIDFYKNENQAIRDDLKKILSMSVSDVMDKNPATITPAASIEEVSRMFADPKINPLPVVSSDNRLVGILSLSDLTKLYGVATRKTFQSREMDKRVDDFIRNFEKQFVLVSKFRSQTWLITSILFAIVGFIIALIFILRLA